MKRWLSIVCVLVVLGPLWMCGCQERRVVREDPLVPANSEMSRMKGADMPPTNGPPLPPSLQHGFKAY